jgi:hypothetical protein
MFAGWQKNTINKLRFVVEKVNLSRLSGLNAIKDVVGGRTEYSENSKSCHFLLKWLYILW